MKKLLLLLSILLSIQGFTQKVSIHEKWWAITHPFVAKKAYKLTTQTRLITKQVKDSSIVEGKEMETN